MIDLRCLRIHAVTGIVTIAAASHAAEPASQHNRFIATDHVRRTIYHSP